MVCTHHARAPSGGDLCEVRAALHRPGPASSGAELSSHCYPPWDAPGGEVGWRPSGVCPSICLSPVGGVERRESQFSHLLSQRLSRYQQFKDFQRRILVATNLFGRGMDIERVNIAFNYDMPEDSDTYLHRVSCPPSPRFLCVRARAVHLCLPREACSFPLFLPGGQSGPLWYQGLGHHICVRRERCQDPQ